MTGRLLGVYVTVLGLACALTAPALAGDPFLERAKRQMDQPPASPPSSEPANDPPSGESKPPASSPEPSAAQVALEEQRRQHAAERNAKVRDRLDPAVREAQRLIDEGKHEEAYAILREVRTRLRDPDPIVETLAAKVALAEGEPAKALEFVTPVAPSIIKDGPFDPETFDILYTLAQSHLAAARSDAYATSQSRAAHKGATFFGIAIDDTKPDERTSQPSADDITRRHAEEARRIFDLLTYHTCRNEQAYDIQIVLAAEGCAQALLELSRPGDAVKAYEFAFARAKASEALFSESGKVEPFLNRLHSALNKARYAFDIDHYGKAFVRYRDAERHRRQSKHYDKALKIYAEIAKEFPDTIWADAAGFYTAQCHLDMNDPRMAAQLWRRFIDADPNGLYRGEALIRLADLALEHDLNPKRAIERYQQAIDWLDMIEEWDKTNDMKRVEERARQVSAAAPGKHGFDDWGNYVVADNRVGALINRATTTWYLPQLRYDARLKMGMALATAGRDQEAHAAFKDLEKYDLRNAYDKDKP